jgi:hypothetical protein
MSSKAFDNQSSRPLGWEFAAAHPERGNGDPPNLKRLTPSKQGLSDESYRLFGGTDVPLRIKGDAMKNVANGKRAAGRRHDIAHAKRDESTRFASDSCPCCGQ